MFAEIVYPLPFRNAFTYSVPAELAGQIKIGMRAVAPFGKRTLTGFIVSLSKTTFVKEEIKDIIDLLDNEPIFDQNSLKFYKWISEYYLSSLGEALKLAVPYGSDIESKKKILSHKETAFHLYKEEKNGNSIRSKILKILSEKDELNFSALQRNVHKKNIYSVVSSLEKAGALSTITEVDDPKVKAKKANFVRLKKSALEIYEIIPEIENRSPKQVKILLELISKKGKGISASELLKKTDAAHSSIISLANKSLVEIYEKEIERKYSEEYQEKHEELILTDAQKKVYKIVNEKIKSSEFKPFLLHGVTGSGKTQVYIELVKEALNRKRTALILVPEISLTPQITSRLLNNFGDKVSVVHSRMGIGERYDTWRRILKGKTQIVIGARSSLFAPLKNIGIIIVDEEHDQSYKQFDSVPKYNARDAAVVLGQLSNCPVLLGSATPSIESMHNARQGKYELVELLERIDDARLPKIILIDILKEKKKKKMDNIFSRFLLDKIEDRLKKKEGVIILQNRRGFSTQIYCDDCGELEACDNCSVSMVYHINKNYLQCHYCGVTKKVPNACTHCGSLAIKYFGTGTERVEDEIEFYFPQAKIKRIDSDSISRKSSLSKILMEFSKGDIDILVGTQMVSKGMDFSRVTLVGVIAAETSLWLPDFRADERTFQLLTQVAGRAGRKSLSGEVLIQTQNEKHFALQKVLQNDYEGFYQKEIFDREKMGYPPFTRLCLIETKDQNLEKAKGAIADFYKELSAYRKYLTIMEPNPAVIARIKGEYRFHILVKSYKEKDPGGSVLRQAVLNSFAEFNRKSRYKDVRLIYDVDPQSIV